MNVHSVEYGQLLEQGPVAQRPVAGLSENLMAVESRAGPTLSAISCFCFLFVHVPPRCSRPGMLVLPEMATNAYCFLDGAEALEDRVIDFTWVRVDLPRNGTNI